MKIIHITILICFILSLIMSIIKYNDWKVNEMKTPKSESQELKGKWNIFIVYLVICIISAVVGLILIIIWLIGEFKKQTKINAKRKKKKDLADEISYKKYAANVRAQDACRYPHIWQQNYIYDADTDTLTKRTKNTSKYRKNPCKIKKTATEFAAQQAMDRRRKNR